VPPRRSWRRGSIKKPESSHQRRPSIAAPVLSDQFGTANAQRLITVDRVQSREKVRHLRGTPQCFRDQARNYPPPLGDLNFFALMQKALYLLEAIAEISDRSSSHVIHLSITSKSFQLASPHHLPRNTVTSASKKVTPPNGSEKAWPPRMGSETRIHINFLVSWNKRGFDFLMAKTQLRMWLPALTGLQLTLRRAAQVARMPTLNRLKVRFVRFSGRALTQGVANARIDFRIASAKDHETFIMKRASQPR